MATTGASSEKYSDHQCLLSTDLQTAGENDGGNVRIEWSEESMGVYPWFNFILNEPKKSLEGLGNMHCTSVLTMKEKNAF